MTCFKICSAVSAKCFENKRSHSIYSFIYLFIIGIAPALEKLRTLGKRLIFVTNNSEYSRKSLGAKIRTLAGFEPRDNELFPVARCAAIYLKHVAKLQGKCYVIGDQGTDLLFDYVLDIVAHWLEHLAFNAEVPSSTAAAVAFLHNDVLGHVR